MPKDKNPLLSILGARMSQDGKKVIVTLVCGEGKEKQYFNTCVKMNNQQKTHVKIENDSVLLKVPMLKEKIELDEDEELPF